MKNKLFSALKFFFGWPLSVLAIIFISRSVFSKGTLLFSQLHGINWWFLLAGTVSFLVYFFIRGYSWQKILHIYEHKHLKFEETNFLWAASEVRRYIPGNIWSFFSRAYLFGEKNIPKVDTSKGLLIEAEMIVIGSLLVALFYLSFVWKAFFSTAIPPWAMWSIVLFVSVCVLVYIFQTTLLQRFGFKDNRFASFIFPGRSAHEYSELILLSYFSFFFFGLGYFFTSMSVVPLNPQLIWQLTGLFALSYAGGYLSLITPSGLGVREGIITFGLSKLISLELAGFVALFNRFILIIAEIIFLALSFVWYKTRHHPLVEKSTRFISAYRYETVLFLVMIIYCMYFTVATFLRYDNFYTGRFDLGNMAQTVWNTAHGRTFQLTDPNGVDTVSRLSTHADFILILLAPFYYLWSNPKMLLVIQTLVLAGGAFLVYVIARYVLKSPGVAFTFALLYLLNPSVQRSNLYDFHPVTLATTFLLAAYYFLLKKRIGWFLLFALLAALTKEHIWLILSLFGAYMFVFQKRRILGSLLFVSGAAMFYYLINYAIPQALGAEHFALAYYSDYGDSPAKIIKNIIFSPLKTISTVLQPDRLAFLRQLTLPLGYVVIFSPFFLIFAGPDFVIDLLSNNPQLHQIYYQYTATITPFLFVAAIYGLAFLWKYIPLPRIIPVIWLVILGVYGIYAYGPLPGSREANLDMFTKPIANRDEIDQFLAHIPKRYSIAASNNVGSHLSQRQQIYTLPIGMDRADMIVLLPDTTTPQLSVSQQTMIASLSADPKYELFYKKDEFVVFKKK